jgi:hypothetical protein
MLRNKKKITKIATKENVEIKSSFSWQRNKKLQFAKIFYFVEEKAIKLSEGFFYISCKALLAFLKSLIEHFLFQIVDWTK